MEQNGIALEIERKFLLSKRPGTFELDHSYYIHHGWIPGEVIQERITYNTRGSGEYWRTIKSGKGQIRIEAQEQISETLYSQLWPITKNKRVEKIRYCTKLYDGLMWEIDVFMDRELVLAEVEFAQGTEVKIPDFLNEYLIREVTEEPEFLNVNLAR